MENELLREALDLARKKTAVAPALACAGRHAMNTIADALGAVRSNSQSSNCGITPAAHRLLIGRHPGNGAERRHDGRVAFDRSDARWCSDGSEVGCENGERVRIAFTLDCCDREAISWAAADGIASGDIRGLMIESVETRFGLANRLPVPVELPSDHGSP